MSFSTLTRYLRLRIQTDLNQPASQNLVRLNQLGNTFSVGETDDLEVRSRGNIVLKPEATEVGGDGSGGEVHIGSASQPVSFKVFASSFSMEGGAGKLLTESSLSTIINKSISGNSNLLSNINYSSLNLTGSIKNSDIASNAAIADSKLATISTAGKVNFSALTGSVDGTVLPPFSGSDGKYLSLSNGELVWGEVNVPPTGVTSFNGSTGDVSYSAPVTSVNGQTGNVTISVPVAYTNTEADARVSAGISSLKGVANGLASLDGNGKLPTSQLPSLAITSTAVVNSQTQMLNLVAEEGDVAIRTDNGKTYILTSSDSSILSNWKEITAAGAVTSVNGQTGTVSLSTTDISEGSNQYYTAARFNSAFSSKSTSDLTEGTNKYYTAARAKGDLVTSNISDSDQTKSPSLSIFKSYSYPVDYMVHDSWSGTNSYTATTNWGVKDIGIRIFDQVSGENIVVENITWGVNFNSFTLTLPAGIVAGSWRVLYWKV